MQGSEGLVLILTFAGGCVFEALLTRWVRRSERQGAREAEERTRTASRLEPVREYVISLRETVNHAMVGTIIGAELTAGGDRDELMGSLDATYWQVRDRAAAADSLRARLAPDLVLKGTDKERLLKWLEMQAIHWQYYLGGLLLDQQVDAPSTTKDEIDSAVSKLLDAIDRVGVERAEVE